MLSNPSNSNGNAEMRFRDAFERLKKGVPILITRGSAITQNNVAREAGCDPSALKKSRHPELIVEIQKYAIEAQGQRPESNRQIEAKRRARNRALREDLELLKIERDKALSLLAEADSKIFDLTMENLRLQAHTPKSNVTPFRAPLP